MLMHDPLNTLEIDNAQFVLVDFQKSFFSILDKNIVKIARSNILLMVKMFKNLGIPMTGTDHYRKGLGGTDERVIAEWNGPEFMDKVTFSCMGQEEFPKIVKNNKRPAVIVAGLETQICVLQTTLDLLRNGYQVFVVKDACLSSTKLRWQNGLDLMEKAGATIVNTETVIFYLLKRVDRPEFKPLVKLLKEQKAYLASDEE